MGKRGKCWVLREEDVCCISSGRNGLVLLLQEAIRRVDKGAGWCVDVRLQ